MNIRDLFKILSCVFRLVSKILFIFYHGIRAGLPSTRLYKKLVLDLMTHLDKYSRWRDIDPARVKLFPCYTRIHCLNFGISYFYDTLEMNSISVPLRKTYKKVHGTTKYANILRNFTQSSLLLLYIILCLKFFLHKIN